MTKQPGSTSQKPSVRVGHLVSLLERVMRNEIGSVLAPLDITLPQFVALFILNSRGSLSNAELARVSHMAPQSANKVVQALASKKYVVHRQDPRHKRILLIQITAEGKAILRRADNAVMDIESRMLGNNSPQEQKQFEQLLMASLKGLGVSMPSGQKQRTKGLENDN